MARKSDKPLSLNLGAFGKHPGWDDHIDDLGLETDRLVEVRRRLYAEGISSNVDSGAWDKLEDGARLPVFEHLILWLTPDEVCLGRLWSSRDAKGRTQYPMALVAEGVGVDPAWLVRTAGPRLERARSLCAEEVEQDKVRASIDQLREDMRSELAAAGDQAVDHWEPDPYLLAAIADRSELATDGQTALGLRRLLYEVEKEMDEFRRPDSKSWRRSRLMTGRPRHMRVPGWGDAGACILAWAAFMRSQLAEEAPLVLIAPVRLGGRSLGWVDVVVGEPGPQEWFCLRAGVRALALHTEIPYTLEPDFVERCRALVEGWKRGELGYESNTGSTTLAKLTEKAATLAQETVLPGPEKTKELKSRSSERWVLGLTLVVGAAVIVIIALVGCSAGTPAAGAAVESGAVVP